MMKLIFVDNSSDLQQRWIEPLRQKGWGVVRARSIEDAERMMILHGEGLQAIVVGEKFVTFAEKNDLVFVVLVQQWTDLEVMKHQNSDHSAIAYLPYASPVNRLIELFEGKAEAQTVETQEVELKATGTDGPNSSPSLEDYSEVLKKPEITRAGVTSFTLASPSFALGGQEISFDDVPEVQPVDFSVNTSDAQNSTMILDTTKLSMDFSSSEESLSLEPVLEVSEPVLEEVIQFSGDLAPVEPLIDLKNESQNESAFAPTYIPEARVEAVPDYTPNQFAVNPTPSASVSDVTTLRSYLALREQDVAVLSGQVRSSQERLAQVELQLKIEKARNAELSHLASKHEQKIKSYDQEKQVELEVLDRQIEDLSSQLKERTDKTRSLEAKIRIASEEIEKIKERVRVDIRRIRVREKDLENQLEILKKDSSALLQARDEKVLELKRKIDLLEFNMELVQEQYSKERQNSDSLKSKLKDAATVMKQAGGLLEQ